MRLQYELNVCRENDEFFFYVKRFIGSGMNKEISGRQDKQHQKACINRGEREGWNGTRGGGVWCSLG